MSADKEQHSRLLQPSVEPVAAALVVEPRISAQLELLQVAQDARAAIALSCVATCGGARLALESTEFDCLLLSTSISDDDHERRDLAALIQLARGRGITVLAFGPGDRHVLGLPVLESLPTR